MLTHSSLMPYHLELVPQGNFSEDHFIPGKLRLLRANSNNIQQKAALFSEITEPFHLMNKYWFRPDFYASRYNCSALTLEQWEEYGHKNPLLGAAFGIISFSALGLYIPFLVAMMRRKFRKMSCYKIMFYLGVVDIGNIFVGGMVTGYLTWVGGEFCTHPKLIYISGNIGFGCWRTGCLTCCLLAFNRCIDFARPHLSAKLFSGAKSWMPGLFNSKYVTWFFDPFVDMPVHYEYDYNHTTHTINNVAVILILLPENVYLIRSISKLSQTSTLTNIAKMKRQFMIQTIIICVLVMVASSVYVYMNYFYLPPALTAIGTFAYFLNSASPAFIYFFLNKSLRREVRRMLTGGLTKISRLCCIIRKGWQINAVSPAISAAPVFNGYG